MAGKIIEKFFSLIESIIFKGIGPKLRSGSLKNLIDKLFVIFEKAGHKFDIVSLNYLRMYRELVNKEIEMAKISSGDNVLVIGCGSLPATSALLAMKTKAKIVSIDRDHRAIKDASNYLKNINLKNQIELEHADGLRYPIKKFDVIFVLYGVKQQLEVLRYLSKHINERVRVVYRKPRDSQSTIFGERCRLSELFQIKKIVSSDFFASLDSYLLSKKTSK